MTAVMTPTWQTPAAPDVLPSELSTAEVVDYLRRMGTSPFVHVRGAADKSMSQMRVLQR